MCALTPHVKDTLFLPPLSESEPPPRDRYSYHIPFQIALARLIKKQATQRESNGSGLQPTRVGDNFEGFYARAAECLWRAESKESHTPGPGPGEGQGILGKSKQ